MKKFFLIAGTVLLSYLLGGTEIMLPVLQFRDPAAARGVKLNPWGGKKHASISTDADKGVLRMAYRDSDATLLIPALNDFLPKIAAQAPPDKFYFKYRVKHLKGQSQIQFHAPDMYVSQLGLRRSFRWETVTVVPGGWSRENKPFDRKKLERIYWVLHGSGEIELSEIGIVYTAHTERSETGKEIEVLSSEDRGQNPVRLDGIVRKEEWSDAVHIRKFACAMDPDNPTEVYLKGSPEGLYCAAVCRKKEMRELVAVLKENTPEIWRDESVELSFDYARSRKRFRKIAINANGMIGGITSALDNCGIRRAVKRYADRWEAEVFVPWRFLDASGQPPALLGFNATRNCYRNGQLQRSAWKTTVWDACADFGCVSLKKKSEKTIPAPIIRRIAQGMYLLEGSGDAEISWEILATSPDGKQHTYNAWMNTDGKAFLPFQIPLTDSGTYHILAVGSLNGAPGVFREYVFNENLLASVKELSIDALTLFPEPKILHMESGVVPLGSFPGYAVYGNVSRGGRIFADEIRDFYGMELKEDPAGKIIFGVESSPEIRSALKRHALEKDFHNIRFDGFSISVTDREILVAAKEPRGVIYGAQTLAELVKMSSGEAGAPVIRKVRLTDWPRQKRRLLHQMLNAFYHQNKYEVKFFKEMLRKHPIASRFNEFSFELGDYYRWECMPIGNHPLSWSKEEFGEIVDYLNADAMKVIPYVQSLGHMEWWLFSRPGQFEELREDGGKGVICTNNPKTYPLLFRIFDEAIRICSGNKELAPDVFYAGLDEVRWETARTAKEKQCRLCAGIPKNRIFANHIRKVNTYLNRRGMRMVMCSDMISEAHNGLNAFKCAEIADEIPRNVILAHWSYLDFPAIPDLARKGYENWKLLTGYSEYPEGEKEAAGCGLAIYTYNWWLSRTRNEGQASYSLIAQRLLMNHAWNQVPEGGSSWKVQVRRYGNFLMHNWSRKPLRHAGKGFWTLDLSGVANTPAAGKNSCFGYGSGLDFSGMDFQLPSIAGIPVKFVRKNNIVQCIKAADTKCVLPAGDKAASLIFLHAANLPESARTRYFERKNYADPTLGPEIARYRVVYADGTAETIPVLYGWNISEWRTDDSRNQVFSRYLADSRFLWTGKTHTAAAANAGNDICVYQYEWVNPHPGKTIREIHLSRSDKDMQYAVFAISARQIK